LKNLLLVVEMVLLEKIVLQMSLLAENQFNKV
jgi:hypothetical protein